MLKRFHRWIDRAWVSEGLCRARASYPPWRLEVVPIGLIVMVFPLDWLSIGYATKATMAIVAFIGAGFLHLYFGWRLAFLTSMTEISQKVARGEEPDPAEIAKFTE